MDPDAFNDVGAEKRVVPFETPLAVENGKVELPPHSVSIIMMEAKQ